MGLLDLLGFVLQCFDVLAWPLFALLYPLYSSIKAIETNSITDTQKLNTYWVVFSFILLFEHAFMKLLEWFSLWPYIRLLIVFSLVMPHFDGAFYVYKHLICPCLSIDPQIVFSLLNKRKESSLVRENFVSEVERYVKENGSEGLEKLIACKSTKTNPDVKEFNAVSFMDNEASISFGSMGGRIDSKALQVMVKKKETTAGQVSEKEPNLTVNEKTIKVAADTETLKTLPPKEVPKEWTAVSPLPTQADATVNGPRSGNKHNATGEALKKENVAEPMFTQTENHTVAAMEVTEKPVDPESPKKVQKEWTCALCQVTVTSERILNSHMQGKKHKAAYEALKARNQPFVPKNSPAPTAKTSDQPNKEPGKSIPSRRSRQKVALNETQKNISPTSKKLNKSKEKLADVVSSNVQKGKIAIHVDKVQSQQPKPSEVAMVKRSPRWCAICSIRCPGEIDMEAHLNGKKHKENVQQRLENLNMVCHL